MASRRIRVVLTIIAVLTLISLGLLQSGMFAQEEGGPPGSEGPGGPPDPGGPPGPGGPDMGGMGAPDMGGGGAAPAAAAPVGGLAEPPFDAAYPALPDFKPEPNMLGGMAASDVQQWTVRAADTMRAVRDAENAEIRAMVGPADRTRWPDVPAAGAAPAAPTPAPKPGEEETKAIWRDSLDEAIGFRNDAIAAASGSSGGYDGARMAQMRDYNATRARVNGAETPWVGLHMMRSLIDPWYATQGDTADE